MRGGFNGVGLVGLEGLSSDKIHQQGGLIVFGGPNKEAIRLQVPARVPTGTKRKNIYTNELP